MPTGIYKHKSNQGFQKGHKINLNGCSVIYKKGVCMKLYEKVVEYSGVEGKILPYGKVFKLRIYGVEKLKAFFTYIYSGDSILFLNRKKQKFIDCFNAYGARGGRRKGYKVPKKVPVDSN